MPPRGSTAPRILSGDVSVPTSALTSAFVTTVPSAIDVPFSSTRTGTVRSMLPFQSRRSAIATVSGMPSCSNTTCCPLRLARSKSDSVRYVVVSYFLPSIFAFVVTKSEPRETL